MLLENGVWEVDGMARGVGLQFVVEAIRDGIPVSILEVFEERIKHNLIRDVLSL